MRSFGYVLLFVLIQQTTVTFFSYSVMNDNPMTSEIQTKDILRRKILGKILKGFFVTVGSYINTNQYICLTDTLNRCLTEI